jgi:hypothetical protein
MYWIQCVGGARVPRGFDPATMEPPAGCTVQKSSATTDPENGEREFYQEPLRPMLITAPGWVPDEVNGYDITWSGPGGAQIRTIWLRTAHPEDPWQYEKSGAVVRDQAIDLLGVRTRLGEYAEGEVDHFALTSGVVPDGTSVLFTSDTMAADEFRTVVESATWTSLQRFKDVVKPAVE